MIFDPVRMCWLSMEVDGEDELDFSFGAPDGEGEMVVDGWEQGEADRMPKNRMSFVIGENDERSGVLWAACVAAEERQEVEMRSWIPSREVEMDEKREVLWDIRRVSSCSSPRRSRILTRVRAAGHRVSLSVMIITLFFARFRCCLLQYLRFYISIPSISINRASLYHNTTDQVINVSTSVTSTLTLSFP